MTENEFNSECDTLTEAVAAGCSSLRGARALSGHAVTSGDQGAPAAPPRPALCDASTENNGSRRDESPPPTSAVASSVPELLRTKQGAGWTHTAIQASSRTSKAPKKPMPPWNGTPIDLQHTAWPVKR